MSEILVVLEGVLCQMDDILVFGKDLHEHNARLEQVLRRIQTSGATLNLKKFEFAKPSLKYLGCIIDEKGIQADPDKTAAIREMKSPVAELRHFLGMANQLGKFSRNLATLTQPLCELLSKHVTWTWNTQQEQAFNRVKSELSILALYNPDAETKISAEY